MEIIELNEIYKSFFSNGKKFNILEDINLNIKLKEIITILGVSGSGKTTLLNIIGGFENYCSGTLVRKDNIKIDYVTQYPHFIDELSVYDNLLFAAFKHKNKGKIEEYLHLFECEKLKKKKTFELSGGEKQRINIIRSLINKPDLLILDEPTASLDNENKIKVSQTLNEIRNNNNLSIVLVTHDRDIIDNFEDRKLFELKNRKLIVHP